MPQTWHQTGPRNDDVSCLLHDLNDDAKGDEEIPLHPRDHEGLCDLRLPTVNALPSVHLLLLA